MTFTQTDKLKAFAIVPESGDWISLMGIGTSSGTPATPPANPDPSASPATPPAAPADPAAPAQPATPPTGG